VIRGRGITLRLALVVWTLAIWGSRVRNILVDDELVGFERFLSLAVALVLIGSATAVAISMFRQTSWRSSALGVLVVVGILRWTLRGPVILLSDEWDAGFKIVHTVLWLTTVALSLLAWSEHRRFEDR
jgi:hypothetical protein